MSSRLDDPVQILQEQTIDNCILVISTANNVAEAIQQLHKLKTALQEQQNEYDY